LNWYFVAVLTRYQQQWIDREARGNFIAAVLN
jgi:hypothetical protein